MRLLLLAICLAFAPFARADIPDEYQPVVVRSPYSFTQRLFDLTPAFQQARKNNKPLLVYLGASDCPPCVDYSHFLESHKQEMKPIFEGLVLVDIRTWLRGARPVFRIFERDYSADEFKALIGDTRKGLYYPSWWLLTPEGRELRSLPQDETLYTSVDSHRKLLQSP
jgi:hypothetical protein